MTASSWHTTPLAQRLIKALHDLTDISDNLQTAFVQDGLAKRWARTDETADAIGTLERCPRFKPEGPRFTYQVSGILDGIYGRLEQLRDDAISDEFSATERERGLIHGSDESDELYEAIAAGAVSVPAAIEAWVLAQSRRVA